MSPRDFAYWLQGFFEITGKDATLTNDQVEMVRRHLDTVFEHEVLERTSEEQRRLDEAHNPPGLKPSDFPRDWNDIQNPPDPGNLYWSYTTVPGWPIITC